MKHKAFSLVLSGILLCSALTACSDVREPDRIDNPKTFVDSNLLEREEEKPTKYDSITFESYTGFDDSYRIADSSYESLGILFVYNKTGHGGLYSLTANKFLVECEYYHEWLDWQVKGDNNAAFIKIDYENKVLIIDNHGNVLFNEEYNPDHPICAYWDVENHYVNGSVYSKLTIDGQEDKIYCYDLGKANEVYSIPEEVLPPIVETDDRHHYQPSDLFKEGYVTDLAEFGNEGYYLNGSRSGVVTMFDSQDKAVSTFLVPTDCEPILTKNNIYYQKLFPLAEDNETFDVYFENSKYAMETYSIDLMNGVQKKITFPYLIKDVTACKDSQGKYTKNIIDMAGINEYKTLNVTRTYLVNDQLKVEADYSELHPESFMKIEENYYNTKTKILYDTNLNVITYLEYMSPELLFNHKLFVGTVDGYKGVIDYQGHVVIPFEYSNIIYNDDFDNVILKDEDGYYLFDLNSKSFTFTAEDATLRVIDEFNEIYTLEGENNAYVVTLDGRHSPVFLAPIFGDYGYHFKRVLTVDAKNDNKMLFIEYNTEDGVKQYVFKYNEKKMEYNSFGNESYVEEKTGRDFEDAIRVYEGSNMIHANPSGSRTFVKLENPTTGYYQIDTTTHQGMSLTGAYIASFGDYGENQNNLSPIDSGEYLLDSNYDYYFILNFTGYRNVDINLVKESSLFSGEKETLKYTEEYPTVKKVTVLKDTYFKFKDYDSSFRYNVYSYDDNGQANVSISNYSYDGGRVFMLSEGDYYFLMYNSSYSYAYYSLDTYEYDDLLNLTPDTIYLERGESALRKFSVSETGDYIVSTSASETHIYKYSGTHGSKSEITAKYCDSVKYYQLESGTTYIAHIKNNDYSNHFGINVKKLAYEDLNAYQLATDSIYFYSYEDNNVVRRVSVNDDLYFYFSGADYSEDYPTVYKINDDNSYELVDYVYFNGKSLYNLKAGEKYVFAKNRVNSSYRMYTYLYDENSLPSLSTNTTYSGTRYVKFTPSSAGLYNIDVTSSYYSLDILAKNTDGVYESVSPAHIEGDFKLYQLSDTETYIIKTYSDYGSSYSFEYICNRVADNVATMPDYSLNLGGFSDHGTYYKAYGIDTSMYFNAFTKGTLTFDYSTYEYYYNAFFYIYVNGVNKLSNTSSSSSGSLTLHLNAGDIVEFELNSYYNDDYFKVSNLVFEPANILKLNVKDVPADKLTGNTLYMWAWGTNEAGKFYMGSFDSATSTYTFIVPDSCENFLVCVAPEAASISWDTVTFQTENIAIQTGVADYSCGTGWKAKQ